MAESILQTDKEHCFLCGMNRNLEPLDKHHVFSGSFRKKSEQYGLTVYLHHSKCHIFGENSVHKNNAVRFRLCRLAQEKAMEHYNWTEDEFRSIFGKSYT